MRPAIIWTVIALIGVVGAIRNVIVRHKNIQALQQKKINGPVILTAQAFRNSEVLRLFQALLGLTIGIATIVFYQSSYWRALQAYRATTPTAEPLIVVIYRNILQYGLVLWQATLVANIWYFGVIGDRAEALRRRITRDYLDEVTENEVATPDEKGKEVTP